MPFKVLEDIAVGDRIVLVSIDNLESPEFVVKEVSKIITERKLLESGYTVELNGSHLFVSKRPEDLQAYAAIEHNVEYYSQDCIEILAFSTTPVPESVVFESGADRKGSAAANVLATDGASKVMTISIGNTVIADIKGTYKSQGCNYAKSSGTYYLKEDTASKLEGSKEYTLTANSVVTIEGDNLSAKDYRNETGGTQYIGLYSRKLYAQMK